MPKIITSISRRTVLKGTAAGIATLAAPAIISPKALASSGEVNFLGWAGYPKLAEVVFPAFEKSTGIKVNFTEVYRPGRHVRSGQGGSSEAGGTDVAEPTIDRWGGWNGNGLLAPMDKSKLAMDNYLPGLADGAAGEMSRAEGKLYYVPSNWGTEALVAKESVAKLSSPPSLGDLFNPENQVVVRPALDARRHGPLSRRAGQAAAPVDRTATRTWRP